MDTSSTTLTSSEDFSLGTAPQANGHPVVKRKPIPNTSSYECVHQDDEDCFSQGVSTGTSSRNYYERRNVNLLVFLIDLILTFLPVAYIGMTIYAPDDSEKTLEPRLTMISPCVLSFVNGRKAYLV